MKILVLGATGMLGHKMAQTLGARFPDTWATTRSPLPAAGDHAILPPERLVSGLDVMDVDAVEAVVRAGRYDAVVNCIGVIKQRSDAKAAIPSITINALLPHRLAAAVGDWGGRLIHFSTDCVFSGSRGNYTEADSPDALDLYGKSKQLGEVGEPNALTLRTSIIGRELSQHRSLLDWFLAQRGQVRGFTRAWWSGVTTNHLADLVGDLLVQHPTLAGIYQVSSGRISKHELLLRVRDTYGLAVDVQPDDSFFCDRSLAGDRLRNAIGYVPPSWDAMLTQLRDDPTPYPTLGRDA